MNMILTFLQQILSTFKFNIISLLFKILVQINLLRVNSYNVWYFFVVHTIISQQILPPELEMIKKKKEMLSFYSIKQYSRIYLDFY